MDGSAWKYYREHFLEGLEQAMESEEYGREEIHAYLEQAGGSGAQRPMAGVLWPGLTRWTTVCGKSRPW
ncbi:MAG: hypothetical protein ACLR7L_19825 [Enterocloster sp.]|uniref:hypothetical protein n=1 Tax=Enterocloster bolteae TaxID=208479 RepID=UPI0003A8652B|nr:hypothetical protein [Enterocloster bolteae]MCG4903728.1 hypothetical protein [Enterocloster bolteae]UOX70116.1 hypothetical protein K4205_00235 [Enterocloster bolteae]